MKTALLGSLAIASLALASCASSGVAGGQRLAYSDVNAGYDGPFSDAFWGGDGGLNGQYGLTDPYRHLDGTFDQPGGQIGY